MQIFFLASIPFGSYTIRLLVREILQKSVELEGRYGALKVLAITHFDLRRGDYGYKQVSTLVQQIAEVGDPREKARLRLDLLGEYYDDWRHALEKSRKIKHEEDFYQIYNELLGFLEAPLPATDDGRQLAVEPIKQLP